MLRSPVNRNQKAHPKMDTACFPMASKQYFGSRDELGLIAKDISHMVLSYILYWVYLPVMLLAIIVGHAGSVPPQWRYVGQRQVDPWLDTFSVSVFCYSPHPNSFGL